jgi:hypothetical protein
MQETHATEKCGERSEVAHIFGFCNRMSMATPFEVQLLSSNKMVPKVSLEAVAKRKVSAPTENGNPVVRP